MADLIQQGVFAAVLLTMGVCLFHQEKSKTGKIICAAAGTVLLILLAFLYRKIQPQGFVGDQFIYLTLLSAIYLTVLAEKPSLRIGLVTLILGFWIYLLYLLVQILTVYIFFDISNVNLAPVLIRQDRQALLVFTAASSVMELLFLVFALRFLTFFKELQLKILSLLGAGMGLLFGLIIVFTNQVFAIRQTMQLTYLMMYGMTAASCVLIVLFLSIQEKERKKQKELDQLERQYALAAENYQGLVQQQRKLARVSHDFRHHLRAIGSLSSEPSVQSYVAEVLETSISEENMLISGNEILDAVINQKKQEAKESGIRFDYEIQLPQALCVENSDLCVILANQLENALEACRKETQQRLGDVWIHVKIDWKDRFLFLMVKNSCSLDPFDEHGSLPSSKDDSGHGWGLKNIEQTAQKYGGRMQISWEDKTFVSVVMLQMPDA